jgi:oxygen-independent coproporphyrinogen-3 oxidase
MANAGLYIHIPFCRKACSYCNFHFSTSQSYRERMLQAMLKELELRWPEWNSLRFETIYFGGGTPSILESNEWTPFLEGLWRIIGEQLVLEFTLEANPEDIDADRIKHWKQQGVSRLSIGLQSLSDDDLQRMNRAHNSQQSKDSIRIAQDGGIENISVDLIYGTPWKDDAAWETELQWVLDQQIPHLSSYALTIEDKTALHHSIQQGHTAAPSDSRAQSQFLLLSQWAEANHWEHYEISNLSRPGFRALHNSRYWNGTPYLGIGPSAHSFDGKSRSWNVANNALYMNQAEQTQQWESEFEIISRENQINEMIMTKLRLSEGLDINIIDASMPSWSTQNQAFLRQQEQLGHLTTSDNRIILSPKGKFLCDFITAELMVSSE